MPTPDEWDAVEKLVFNPATVLTAAAAYGLMQRTQMSFLALVNPWELSLLLWIAGYAAVRFALLGFVDGLAWLVASKCKPLPSRTGPKPVFQHSMNVADWTYLGLNSFIEFVFAQQIGRLIWHSPIIARAPSAVGLLNGPVALWLLLVVDDMLYAPLHRIMHLQPFYRWVHKHHHRNTYPSRGYVDAANEHPLEQIWALSLHWLAVHIVAYTTGLHVAAVRLATHPSEHISRSQNICPSPTVA
jgi:sterol desaturase/sphingolipid hydroxylase (fatty acid hydroxylase superfamily)